MVLRVAKQRLCLALCLTRLTGRLEPLVRTLPTTPCAPKTLLVVTRTLARRFRVLLEGRRTTIAERGKLKCPFPVLDDISMSVTDVVTLTMTARILVPTKPTALQTVTFEAMMLLGEPTQRQTLPAELRVLKNNSRVMTEPVTLLLTGLDSTTTWLPNRCEQTLQVCLLCDDRLTIAGIRPTSRFFLQPVAASTDRQSTRTSHLTG